MKLSLKLLAISSIVLLAACASAPSNPYVGAWTVNIDSPIGAIPGTLSFMEDGTGTMLMEVPGQEGAPAQEIADVVFEEGGVAFSAEIDAGGNQMTMSFTGKLDGEALTGELDTDFGAFPVTGTRQ